jgi:hypothetical protein
MTDFPRSPRLQRGAIVGIDKGNPLASVIIFQYNPAKMTRKITFGNNSDGKTPEVNRTSGAPQETITLDIEIDATDQLEKAESTATSMGIYPQLSALEMLLYPKSARVIINSVLAATGVLEVIPSEAPLTLFIWGIKRVVPIRLTQFTINEEAYDTKLNPILAKVTLAMRVLSYNDFQSSNPGYFAFMAHQVIKETMAVIGSVNNLGSIGQ